MKLSRILPLVVGGAVAGIMVSGASPAQAITYNFGWTGDTGYTATGSFSYDETQGYSTVTGSQLQSLSISFYNPSAVLLNSFTPVTDGVNSYQYLNFNFNTSTVSLFNSFDVGKDNGLSTDYYLLGTAGSSLTLYNGNGNFFDSNSGSINVTLASAPVPFDIPGGATIPTVGSLLALGAMRKAKKRLAVKTLVVNPVVTVA